MDERLADCKFVRERERESERNMYVGYINIVLWTIKTMQWDYF